MYLRNLHFPLQEIYFVPGSTGNKSSALSQWWIKSSTSSTTRTCLESALNPWSFEAPTTATRPGRVDVGMSRLEFFWLTWHEECHSNMSKHTMILHYGTSNDNANVELKVYRWKHSVIDPQVELERVGEELRCVWGWCGQWKKEQITRTSVDWL